MMLNRETLIMVGVIVSLALCCYLYKELQKVQKGVSQTQSSFSSLVSALTPVNDTKPVPVAKAQAQVQPLPVIPELNKEE